MIRPRPSPGATPIALALVAVLMSWPAASHAQSAAPAVGTASPDDDVIRLSDDERAAIMARQTVDSAAAARGEMTGADRAALGIHGEVGATIGSNGARGAYGTAAIPLGDHAGAVVSFESDRFGHLR